jgi:hypothetical protein
VRLGQRAHEIDSSDRADELGVSWFAPSVVVKLSASLAKVIARIKTHDPAAVVGPTDGPERLVTAEERRKWNGCSRSSDGERH